MTSMRYTHYFVAMAVATTGCSGSDADDDTPNTPRTSLPVCVNAFGDLQDGDREQLGSVEVTHRFRLASGMCWHYVEAGRGELVVFVHGFPESWWSWHHQLEALSDAFRVVAIDMKAYGQTEKPEGDYRAVTVADETFPLLAGLGHDKFFVVSHDWGSIISEPLTCQNAAHIAGFVRMEAPLLVVDLNNAPQLELFKDQDVARAVMSNPEALMNLAYGRLTLQPLPDEVLARIADEFRYPGIADAVPRYFRDLDLTQDGPLRAARMDCFSRMTFPLLLLQADQDPNQPAYYFDGATELFPDAELSWVTDSGHFSELEQPEQVSRNIRDFFTR